MARAGLTEKETSETKCEGGAVRTSREKAPSKRKITYDGTEGLSGMSEKQRNSYLRISQGGMMVAETTQTAVETMIHKF